METEEKTTTYNFTRWESSAIGVALHYIIEHTNDPNLEEACASALEKIEQ